LIIVNEVVKEQHNLQSCRTFPLPLHGTLRAMAELQILALVNYFCFFLLRKAFCYPNTNTGVIGKKTIILSFNVSRQQQHNNNNNNNRSS
jgi:hypothetical protein